MLDGLYTSARYSASKLSKFTHIIQNSTVFYVGGKKDSTTLNKIEYEQDGIEGLEEKERWKYACVLLILSLAVLANLSFVLHENISKWVLLSMGCSCKQHFQSMAMLFLLVFFFEFVYNYIYNKYWGAAITTIKHGTKKWNKNSTAQE